jgi:D-sedoheptulose 7-phosphate isomerase
MSHRMSVAARASAFSDLLVRCRATSNGNVLQDLEVAITDLCARLTAVRTSGRRVYLLGNGGSAAIAGHAATDLFNVGKLRAMTLHESSMLTCMANDFGYENAFAQMLSAMVEPGDLVIAISSSGKSMNIRNAATQATNNGGQVITLSGFASDNPLRYQGIINFWLDSMDYGMVEIGHQFLLHNISDRLGAALTGESGAKQ